MARVLVVEDDQTVAEVVLDYLRHAGLDSVHAADGAAALAAAAEHPPDIVLLDLMLPGVDGLEVCRRLRAARGDLPVIMLTARGEPEDRILGLEVGADDYVTKPFSPRELVLRVQSVLRRTTTNHAPAQHETERDSWLVDGDIEVDTRGHRVWRAQEEIALTAREFDLLVHLLTSPGQAFTREELMRTVWGWEFGDLSTVTVHVRRLREKLEADPSRPVRLVTVWGVGYRWDRQGGR